MPKRYTVKAYLGTELMCNIQTDDYRMVQDFIYENTQTGYNCELIDNERGTIGWTYATEESIDYGDLLMEQQEQM